MYLIIIVHVVESHERFVVCRDLQYVLEGVVSDDLTLVERQTRPVNAESVHHRPTLVHLRVLQRHREAEVALGVQGRVGHRLLRVPY